MQILGQPSMARTRAAVLASRSPPRGMQGMCWLATAMSRLFSSLGGRSTVPSKSITLSSAPISTFTPKSSRSITLKLRK